MVEPKLGRELYAPLDFCERDLYKGVEHAGQVMSDSSQDHIYKVIFHSMGQIYEVYAHSIYSSDLYGFIEVEDYIFGEKTKVVIDPSEDKLRTEFDGVQRSFIPMHAVIRIDEVEKEGVAKVTESKGGNVTPFPMPVPGDRGKKS